MANDGHIESGLALQATRFEHYRIAYKWCRHNFDVFTALDALPMQLIAQAHSRPFSKQQLEVSRGQSQRQLTQSTCLSVCLSVWIDLYKDLILSRAPKPVSLTG